MALLVLVLASLLIQLFSQSAAREFKGGRILVGTSIGAGDSWVSEGGRFAIGLILAADDKLKLCIWYNSVHVEPKTIVWTATGTDSSTGDRYILQVSYNSRVVLRNDGLYMGQRPEIISESCNDGCRVQAASITDEGNFVLVGGSNEPLWNSFDYPTDTLLPEQSFAKVNKILFSGKYKLRLQKNSVQLEPKDFVPPPPNIAYWSLYNPSFNSSDPSLTKDPALRLSKDGVLTYADASGKPYSEADGTTIRYTSDYGNRNITRRLVLEENGNMRIYSLSSNNDSWSIVWQAVMTECSIHHFCGPFGICSYSPRAICNCPPGFRSASFVASDGCIRDRPLQCSNSTRTRFVELARADYALNDIDQPFPISLEECKSKCMQDCSCLGAAYKLDGSGRCFIKGQPKLKTDGILYNGQQDLSMDNIVFLKASAVPTPNSPSPFVTVVKAFYIQPQVTEYKVVQAHFARATHMAVVALMVAVTLLGVLSCTVLGLAWKEDRRKMMQRYAMDIQGAPAKFSFEELKVATNNSTEELGSGAFGSVYKGVLSDERPVAVKRLEGAIQAEKQFKAEVSTIGRIHHFNLVRLLGYCAEGRHRLLVLEYMPNGSLEKLLFAQGEKDRSICDWNTRYTIAFGVARGIMYLHEECRECILHCDIKPQNILLDEELQPRVSDFGLAKLITRDRPFSITSIAGTRGYLAPEWISNLQITPKVDVYSFGMVLLEIISGRDNFKFTESAVLDGNWHFPAWAFRKFLEGNPRSIADPQLQGIDWEQFDRMLKAAFWCVQLDMNARPSMSRVVQMLEGTTGIPNPPCPLVLGEGTSIPASMNSKLVPR